MGLGEGRSTWGKAGKFLVGVASFPELPTLRDAAGAVGSVGTRAQRPPGARVCVRGPGRPQGISGLCQGRGLGTIRHCRGSAKHGQVQASAAACCKPPPGWEGGEKRSLFTEFLLFWVSPTQNVKHLRGREGVPRRVRGALPQCHRAGDGEGRSPGRSVPKPAAGEEMGRESEKEGGREGGAPLERL